MGFKGLSNNGSSYTASSICIQSNNGSSYTASSICIQSNNGSSYTASSICIQSNNIPMQSQTMQECRQPFHKNQDGNGKCCPHGEHDPQSDPSTPTFKHQAVTQHHVPQHLGQLCNNRHMLQCRLQMSIMLERSTPHFHIWEVTGSITGLGDLL